MARPKAWRTTFTGAGTTVIYWPTDTWISTQEYAFNFRMLSGTGSFATGCSASRTIDRVLSDGVVSAHWIETTAFSAGVAFQFNGPASCWRLTVSVSGAGTAEIMAMQSGTDRVQ